MDDIDNHTSFEVTRSFPVSRKTLFDALINESILKSIWGVSNITVDARQNGQTRAQLEIENENWNFTITYKEVVPYDKLRWVVHFDRFPDKEPRVTLSFSETTDGSELTVRIENYETSQERDANKQAWDGALKKLVGLVDR